jgi:hypothetical protein
MTIQEMVQNGTVVDVRTHGEFMGGNVAGSKKVIHLFYDSSANGLSIR